jgi:hypothetical protein
MEHVTVISGTLPPSSLRVKLAGAFPAQVAVNALVIDTLRASL